MTLPTHPCKDAKTIVPDLSEFVSTNDAAVMLKLHAETVRQLLRDGVLEGIKANASAWLVSKKSIKAYLEKNKGLAKTDPNRNWG